MAVRRHVTQTPTAVAASYTVTLGAHQTGDLLLVQLTQQGGATTIAPDATATAAGWQILAQARASTTVRFALAWKIAASASEPNPTFTGSNDDWLGSCIVEDDAHASPFGSIVSGTDYTITAHDTSSTTITPGALTTAVDGCKLMWFVAAPGPGATHHIKGLLSDTRADDKATMIQIAQVAAHQQQQSAGAAPQPAFYHSSSTAAVSLVIAIRNVSGGALQPDVRPTINELYWYGNMGAVRDPAVSWSAPSAFAATINSIVCSSAAPTASAGNSADTKANWGTHTTLPSNQNVTLIESPAGSGAWVGGTHAISSTDMTGLVFGLQFYRNLPDNDNAAGGEGMLVGFTDGTNWAVYQVQNKLNGWVSSLPYGAFIALGQATAYASSGSINWAAVTGILYAVHRISSATTNYSIGIKNATLFTTAALTGGGSSRPAKYADFADAMNSWGGWEWATLNGSGQLLAKSSLQIGDGGSNTTYFDGAASSLEFPPAFGTTAVSQMKWNATAGAVSLSVKAGASDTINLAAGVAATETNQDLTVDSASSTSADYNFAQSFVGWSPTWKTGVACTGATFASCGPVNFKGASPTSITVNDTLATASEGAISFDANGATLTTSTIDVTGTSAGYHISLGASVTGITLNGNTFTGTPGTDKIYSALASGTLTITWDGVGTALAASDVTFVGGSTAVASVVAPTLERGISFTGLQAGTSIQVFTSGTQTKLFGDNSTAGSTFAFDDATSGSITVDYTIQKAGYLPQRVTGQVLTGSVGGQLDVTITQIPDRAYSASSGLTYGTTAVVTVGTNPTTNPGTKTFTLSATSTGQNWYSFWIEQWIDKGNATGEALANVEFPLAANGPNSFTLNDGWTFSDGATSIAFLSRDGLRYLNTSDVLQKAWAAILTSGVPAGSQVRYQQSDAGTTVNAANTGEMDQLVQIYDVGVYDYRGYLVLKVQREGYDQAESNVVTLYGNLEDQLYVVGLTPTANVIATGDPALTITISQGTYVEDGKTFSVKIVDNATPSSGEDILRELRYNFAAGGTYQGEDAFNWHDLVRTNGDDFKTVNGIVYGTATTKGVLVYQNDGTTLHPDFTLFTADNGTTYAPPPAATIAIGPFTSGSRVQIYDETSATELFNDVVAATSKVFTETYSVDRSIRVRISYVSGVTAKEFIETIPAALTFAAPNLVVTVAQVDDPVYNTNAVNGSLVTGITFTDAATDLVNINIAGGATTYQDIYAAFVYWLFTATGIDDDVAYVDAIDPANYEFTSMKIKNTSSPSVPLTITGGFGRDATSGTIADIIDTTGGNIYPLVDHVVSKVVTVGGVNVITGDIADIPAAPSAATVAGAVRTELTVELANLDAAVSAVPAATWAHNLP